MSLHSIPATRREAGMSLVELLVGMLIGLIGIVIIAHLYITNEQYKRSTTAAGSAQVNGAIALYALERDIRMAGYGVNNTAALGCAAPIANGSPIQYYYDGKYSNPPGPPGPNALPPLELAPLVITETAGQPDAITLLFGSNGIRSLPTTLAESMPSPSAEFKLDGVAGFAVNDLIVVTQGTTCALAQVTQVQDAAVKLQHNPGVTAPWNPVGGGSLLPAFTQGASVFDLGQPTWRTYNINLTNNVYQLQLSEVITGLAGGAALQIMDDIVDMQAEYGKDNGVNNGTVANAVYAADDGIIDSYDTVKPANATQWTEVLAVRIGILARSGNYERPSVAGGACEATTVTPTWAGSTNPNSVFNIPGGLPSCYRYRVFETVVPLRNMIWRPA